VRQNVFWVRFAFGTRGRCKALHCAALRRKAPQSAALRSKAPRVSSPSLSRHVLVALPKRIGDAARTRRLRAAKAKDVHSLLSFWQLGSFCISSLARAKALHCAAKRRIPSGTSVGTGAATEALALNIEHALSPKQACRGSVATSAGRAKPSAPAQS
jgi:hypothetical protein